MYIIFSDIQGTITNSNNEIANVNSIKSIKKAQENGIEFVLNTALDSVERIEELARHLNVRYICGGNGSFIYDRQDKNFIYKAPMNSTTTKADSVINLCNILGAKVEESMTIGDSENDWPAFALTDNSYVMANADPETQKHANRFTSAVEQNGIGEAIDDYMFRMKI